MKKEIKGENVTNKNLVTIKIKQRKEPITGLYVNHDNNWVAVLENTYDYVLDGYTFINREWIDHFHIETDRISAKILSLNYSPMWKYEGKGIDCTNTMHIFSTFMEKKENIAIGLESDDYILVGKISKLNRKSIVLNKIDEQTNFIQSQRIPFSKIRLIEYKNNYLTSLSKYENLFASID